MTEKKPTTTRKAAAKPKAAPSAEELAKAKEETEQRVAVLQTSVNIPLIIRGNPSPEDVVKFAKEQNRRYQNGDPGGPSGQSAFLIRKAAYFAVESATDDYDFEQGESIDINDALIDEAL